jgi:hypothetical protein
MRLIILAAVSLLISACSKKGSPTIELQDMADTSATAVATGTFENGPYGTVAGQAGVYRNARGELHVLLQNFNTSNGPDLHVYLSAERMPANFVILGKLKATAGIQVYNIPTGTDVANYKYVCIHCKAYNHLFGSALIK